jgi:formate hydrogenlyase subunit 4
MLIFGVLITNLFIPWGVALTQGFIPLVLGALSMLVKLMLLGAVLALSESVLAKMRLFRAPEFLSLAFILSLLGMLSHVVLEVH